MIRGVIWAEFPEVRDGSRCDLQRPGIVSATHTALSLCLKALGIAGELGLPLAIASALAVSFLLTGLVVTTVVRWRVAEPIATAAILQSAPCVHGPGDRRPRPLARHRRGSGATACRALRNGPAACCRRRCDHRRPSDGSTSRSWPLCWRTRTHTWQAAIMSCSWCCALSRRAYRECFVLGGGQLMIAII